jgi:hypothetical protein
MKSHMLRVQHYHEVLRTIIQLVMVNVMDIFVRFQLSTKMSLHDYPLKSPPFSANHHITLCSNCSRTGRAYFENLSAVSPEAQIMFITKIFAGRSILTAFYGANCASVQEPHRLIMEYLTQRRQGKNV